MAQFCHRSIFTPGASVLLAGVYALLAVAGDSLHALSHAPGSQAAACSCGFHHAAPPSDRAADRVTDEAASALLRVARPSSHHDTATCVVCKALDKLKLGGVEHGPHAGIGEWSVPPAALAEAIARQASIGVLDARGPPTRA
jgi:hypothetical protein